MCREKGPLPPAPTSQFNLWDHASLYTFAYTLCGRSYLSRTSNLWRIKELGSVNIVRHQDIGSWDFTVTNHNICWSILLLRLIWVRANLSLPGWVMLVSLPGYREKSQMGHSRSTCFNTVEHGVCLQREINNTQQHITTSNSKNWERRDITVMF